MRTVVNRWTSEANERLPPVFLSEWGGNSLTNAPPQRGSACLLADNETWNETQLFLSKESELSSLEKYLSMVSIIPSSQVQVEHTDIWNHHTVWITCRFGLRFLQPNTEHILKVHSLRFYNPVGGSLYESSASISWDLNLPARHLHLYLAPSPPVDFNYRIDLAIPRSFQRTFNYRQKGTKQEVWRSRNHKSSGSWIIWGHSIFLKKRCWT